MKFARGYVASAADQSALMKATGLSKLHVKCGDIPGEAISNPIWALRPGELLAVNSVRDFAEARTVTQAHSQIAAAIEWVQSQGAEVYEISSGERTGTGKGAQMISRALSKIHGAVRMIDPVAMQAKAAKGRTKNRMPKAEAKRIWRDIRRYPRWQDAIAAMPGWNKVSAYDQLGKRGGTAGRPRKS